MGICQHNFADRTGHILCLEASLEAARRIQYLNNLHIAACDDSPQQQWFFNSESRIRSGLKTCNGEDLFMVQELLPVAQNPYYTASYNLYHSSPDGFNASADFLSSSFTHLSVANYKSFLSLRDPEASGPNLVQNGGFENSTLLPANPDFYDGEIFSVCGWAILHAPELVPRASWVPADGNFSLLMSKSASINQTIPPVQGSEYLLTFSVAGYIGHDADTEPFQPCKSTNPVYVTANAQTFGEISKTFQAYGDRKWTTEKLTFITVSNSTVIVLGVSYGNYESPYVPNCGPLVDAVTVSLKPPTPSWFTRTRILALCIAGLATLFLLMAVPLLFSRAKATTQPTR